MKCALKIKSHPFAVPLTRDATPDFWGRRVIEARLKVPANSLPESTYLLEAGSDRIGDLEAFL